MAMNPVELRIIIDAQNKASAVLAKANKDVKALSAANATMLASVNPSAVTGMTRGFANIGLAATAAGTRIAAAGSAFTAFAGKYWMVGAAGIAMGAAAKSGALLEARIGALGDNVEETKEKLKDMSEASGGAFSMPEIVDAQNKIKAFGIALKLTPTMLMNIQGRAAQMGITTTKALDDVILGISRGSRKILDNIGIVVSNSEANAIWAKKLGKSVHQLTDAERRAGFLSLTMRELNKSTLAATSSYSASLKTTAHMKDAWAALSLAMAPLMRLLEPIASAFMSLAQMTGSILSPVMESLAIIFAPLLQLFAGALKIIASLVDLGLKPLAAAITTVWEIIGEPVVQQFTKDLTETSVAIGKNTDAHKDAVKFTRQALGATGEAAAAQTDLAQETAAAANVTSAAAGAQASLAKNTRLATFDVRIQIKALRRAIGAWNKLAALGPMHYKEKVFAGGLLQSVDGKETQYAELLANEKLDTLTKTRKEEEKAYEGVKKRYGKLSKRQAADRRRLKNIEANRKGQVKLNKAYDEAGVKFSLLHTAYDSGGISQKRYQKSIQELEGYYNRMTAAINSQTDSKIAENAQDEKKDRRRKRRRGGRGRREKVPSEADLQAAFMKEIAADEKSLEAANRREEAHQAGMEQLKTKLKLLKLGSAEETRVAALNIEHAAELKRLEDDQTREHHAIMKSRSELSLDGSKRGYEHGKSVDQLNEKYKLLNETLKLLHQQAVDAIKQSEYDAKLDRERMARLTALREEVDRTRESINGMNEAFRASAGVMGSVSPPMAGAHAALGQVSGGIRTLNVEMDENNAKAREAARAGGMAVSDLANVTGDSSKNIAGAITSGLGAMGPAVAGFIDDQRTQAGVMALFEAAMAVASWWKNPAESYAHGVAAAMFAGIAATGVGIKSSAKAGGRGVAAQPTAGMVPHGDREGPKQIVINFTDGMILGDAQSLAKKINETLDHASGNGVPANGA